MRDCAQHVVTRGMPVLQDVVLSAEEAELFAFLKEVVEHTASGTTMRVAGGWVRDKLLGKRSNDIDIAVDNMSGSEFRALIYAHLEKGTTDMEVDSEVSGTAQKKRKAAQDESALPAPKKAPFGGRKGVITARPEKGKHVECTTLRTHGFDLDLISLRSNAQLRRSTEVTAGEDVTAEEALVLLAMEDAHLRDFTVSALFYNINTGLVEDFVGGKADLERGIICCPTPWDEEAYTTALQAMRRGSFARPEVTEERRRKGTHSIMNDDSLRLLRAVRFACRFGFEMCPLVKEVAHYADIAEAFAMKPDAERKTTEIHKMLKTAQPARAMRLLCELDIAASVFPFNVPTPPDLWSSSYGACNVAVEAALASYEGGAPFSRECVALAAMLLPLCGREFTYRNGEKKPTPMTRDSIKIQWKYAKAEAGQIMDLVESALEWTRLVSDFTAGPSDGLWIASGLRLRIVHEAWKTVGQMALALDLHKVSGNDGEQARLRAAYEGFATALSERGLLGCDANEPAWKLAAVLKGKELQQRFQLKGKAIGNAVALAVAWKMLHPASADEFGCAEYVRARLQ
mmetsp:Transcript_17508/g.67914  ORF Transcript_17508/g.67914 Transcript_17508/m.67914 type:complete len:571 (-) Transcript_17508:30-1742(-)